MIRSARATCTEQCCRPALVPMLSGRQGPYAIDLVDTMQLGPAAQKPRPGISCQKSCVPRGRDCPEEYLTRYGYVCPSLHASNSKVFHRKVREDLAPGNKFPSKANTGQGCASPTPAGSRSLANWYGSAAPPLSAVLTGAKPSPATPSPPSAGQLPIGPPSLSCGSGIGPTTDLVLLHKGRHSVPPWHGVSSCTACLTDTKGAVWLPWIGATYFPQNCRSDSRAWRCPLAAGKPGTGPSPGGWSQLDPAQVSVSDGLFLCPALTDFSLLQNWDELGTTAPAPGASPGGTYPGPCALRILTC